MSICVFCKQDFEIIKENQTCILFKDKFPVVDNHMIIIPKRHVENAFEFETREVVDLFDLFWYAKAKFNLNSCNFGTNIGKFAGQTVFHAHFHIIPRKENDVKEKTGGMRDIILRNKNDNVKIKKYP